MTACKERRMLEMSMRQHGDILDIAAAELRKISGQCSPYGSPACSVPGHVSNSLNCAQISHMCQNNFALSLILSVGRTMHITGHSRPFAPLVALRFGHCAFGAA